MRFWNAPLASCEGNSVDLFSSIACFSNFVFLYQLDHKEHVQIFLGFLAYMSGSFIRDTWAIYDKNYNMKII